MNRTSNVRSERSGRDLIVGAVLAALVSVCALAGPPLFTIDWSTIDGGGGTSVGDTFVLSGTIGQPDAGEMAGGDFTLVGGWWSSVAAPVPRPPCPADLDGDGSVGGSDLGILLVAWGTSTTADLNGDGLVDGADLGLLLNAWGDCPE